VSAAFALMESMESALVDQGFDLVRVESKKKVSDFPGDVFYELLKREDVSEHKKLVLWDGAALLVDIEARRSLGLSGKKSSVSPPTKAGVSLFVQSTSHNRALAPESRILVARKRGREEEEEEELEEEDEEEENEHADEHCWEMTCDLDQFQKTCANSRLMGMARAAWKANVTQYSWTSGQNNTFVIQARSFENGT